jgi:hypothetical protein
MTETEALASNQAITTKVPSVECTVNLDVGNTCTADFEPVSTDFQDACLNGGGRFYTTDVTYDCTTFAFGATYDADYTYLSFPACVGMSCTDDELKTYFSNNVHPYMEESFASKGLTCEVSDNSGLSIDSDGNGASSSAADAIHTLSQLVMPYLMFVTAMIAL